ncbi:MAG: EutP/PduV family microcompartment system protein [Candidatus Adiutrix sp.]
MIDKQKPLMVIGPVSSGKSTLLNKLNLAEGAITKTEAVTYLNQAIDTPGEMTSIPRFYNALIVNSVRARIVLFLMSAARPILLPARLAQALRAPVVGVISKIDEGTPEGIEKARLSLITAGASEIFYVSSVTGEGIDDLIVRLKA